MTVQPSGYFGLHQIAARLGVSRNTVLNWYERYGLFMFRRRVGPRWVWWTHEGLIRTWELARVKVDREAWLRRKRAREGPQAPLGPRSETDPPARA